MNVPTDYLTGLPKASEQDPETASNYVAHTVIGDPLADAMLDDLAHLPGHERTHLFHAVMQDRDEGALSGAPPSVRAFFHDAERVPDWVDFDAFTPGIRMFHRNSKLILGAFVGGTLVEGFATNISKSFFITGRLREQGVRRLRQNIRHMVEIFMPYGLKRDSDGWKLSVRIRLIHAQVRRLLKDSEDWDHEAWGTPISAAHVGYAITSFSARLLMHLKSLGASYSDEERKSFMAVWRYSGLLMGIPESILFKDEEEALRLFRIGTVCEPPPDFMCVALANSLVNSAPIVVGIDDSKERRDLAKYVYTVSRALIGNELADQLKYPSTPTIGVLTVFRMQERFKDLQARLNPRKTESPSFTRFASLLEAMVLEEAGISYRLPDHVYAEEGRKW